MAFAFFAGGCFWGMEAVFQQIPGVIRTQVGYMGGTTQDPTYQEVCSDSTGHAETVAIEFDYTNIQYHQLLDFFFSNHNPTELNRQGPDIGTQYRSVIFYITDEQKNIAEKFIRDLEKSGLYEKKIVTQVLPAPEFWPAEEYHQSYFLKIAQRYGPGNL